MTQNNKIFQIRFQTAEGEDILKLNPDFVFKLEDYIINEILIPKRALKGTARIVFYISFMTTEDGFSGGLENRYPGQNLKTITFFVYKKDTISTVLSQRIAEFLCAKFKMLDENNVREKISNFYEINKHNVISSTDDYPVDLLYNLTKPTNKVTITINPKSNDL